ncbi:MAG TPA: serine hydrolase domain-containing protein, partial [Segetibacter sp.]
FKTLEEEVNEFASKRDIQTNAGEEFRYSNVGFNIAARVLEVVGKKPFDKLIQDRITRQIGMRGTTFSNEDYNDAVNPSNGARSTATDFTNFLAMLLGKGTFNNKQILTPASVEMLHTLTTENSKIKYAPKTVEGLNYALGEWILAADAQGKTSAVAVPSLKGTWVMMDICRGYACVIFTKDLPGEQLRNVYLDIKSTIDNSIGGNCN